MDDAMDDMKASTRRLLGQEPEEKSTLHEMEEAVCGMCPTMNYRGRMIGFGVCLALGSVLTLGSFTRLAQLARGNPHPFVVYYALGSLLSLSSSFFFTGPWKQLKSMFSPVRICATICYLVSLALTLFVALTPAYVPARNFLLIILVIIQFVSYVWYTLSYIPFARSFVSGFWSGLRGR